MPLYPQDNGYLGVTEIDLGTYPASALPAAVAPSKVHAPSATDAGSLAVAAPSELAIGNYILGTEQGAYPSVDTTAPASALPTYSEGPDGITLDSTAVPADRVGIISREFTPGSTYPELVRVAEGQQYAIRWHVTSTQQSNLNPQFRMRARSVKFGWSQKLEIGGAWATGGATANRQLPDRAAGAAPESAARIPTTTRRTRVAAGTTC